MDILTVLKAIHGLMKRYLVESHYTSQEAFVLTLLPQKILEKNDNRIVQNLQNQEGAAIIYYRYGGDGVARSYWTMVPGTTEVQDRAAPLEELWAYSDTDGAIFTIKTVTKNGG